MSNPPEESTLLSATTPTDSVEVEEAAPDASSRFNGEVLHSSVTVRSNGLLESNVSFPLSPPLPSQKVPRTFAVCASDYLEYMESMRFKLILPVGATPGTLIENIDGRGASAIIPDECMPGDTLIIVARAPQLAPPPGMPHSASSYGTSIRVVLPTFPPDCGAFEQAPHLSINLARQAKNVLCVRRLLDDGTYTTYPYDEPIPMIGLPTPPTREMSPDCAAGCGTSGACIPQRSGCQPNEMCIPVAEDDCQGGKCVPAGNHAVSGGCVPAGSGSTSVAPCFLDEFGLGISFYFKLLKALGIIFAIMTGLTIPNIVMFSSSSVISDSNLYYTSTLNSQKLLAQATIAALQEPTPFCRQTNEGATFRAMCSKNFRMASVVAYYGWPTGQCQCPLSSTLNKLQTCPGNIGIKNNTQVCIDNTPCFKGATRYNNNCCSKTKDAQGNGDLYSLIPAPTRGCNSLTAYYLSAALCQDHNTCTFPVSFSAPITVPVSQLPAGTPLSSVCSSITTDASDVQQCTSSLGYNGDFSNCGGSNPSKPRNFVFEAICFSDTVYVGQKAYKPATIVLIATSLNALAALTFIIGVIVIRFAQNKEAKISIGKSCTAADYTVVCYTLPTASTIGEVKKILRDHLEKVLFDPRDGFPVDIADINVSISSLRYLDAMCARGDAAKEVDLAVAKIESLVRRGRFDKEKNSSHVRSLKRALLNFEVADDECYNSSAIAEQNGYSAYITFETEQARVRCLEKFSNFGILTPFLQDKNLRLNGKSLLIDKPPEPAEIIWENLPVSRINHLTRVLIATGFAILTLGISYAMIYEASVLKQNFGSNNVQIPCDTYDVNLVKNVSSAWTARFDSSTITYLDVLKDKNPSYYNVSASSDYGSYGFIKCFCQEVLYEASRDKSNKNPLNTFNTFEFYDAPTGTYQPYCKQFVEGSALATAANYIATFVIIIVNMNLKFLLNYCVKFERHSTQSGAMYSMAVKLFLAQYVNTAMLSLIINGSLTKAGGTNVHFGTSRWISFGIFTGNIQDYNTEWYNTVGASICFTMFMFTLGDQPGVFIAVLLNKLARLWDRRWSFKKGVTHKDVQSELNDMYVGPQFPLVEKYAAILTLVFVDMTYSATMPLFNIITAFNLLIIYASDKFTLLRFYKRPPAIDHRMPKSLTNFLFVAALIHVCNGMWMFGNSQFSNPEWTTTINYFRVAGVLFPWVSHKWDFPIDWYARILGFNSKFLFALFLFLLATLGIWLCHDVLGRYFGGRFIFKWTSRFLAPFCQRNLGIQLPTFDIRVEGNPPYFEAIPLATLEFRLAQNTLDKSVLKKYRNSTLAQRQLRDELGSGFSVAKSAQIRYRRASEQLERRATISRASEDYNQSSAQIDAAYAATATAEQVARDFAHSPQLLPPDDRMDDDDDEEDEKEDCVRVLQGHESYNINTNPDYVFRFGTETKHLRRVQPRDLLMAKTIFDDVDSDTPELLDLIHECRPRRVHSKGTHGEEDTEGKIRWQDVLFERYLGWFGGYDVSCNQPGACCNRIEIVVGCDDNRIEPTSTGLERQPSVRSFKWSDKRSVSISGASGRAGGQKSLWSGLEMINTSHHPVSPSAAPTTPLPAADERLTVSEM